MPESTIGVERLARQLPQLTLMAVVVAVLLPAANHSIRLSDRHPLNSWSQYASVYFPVSSVSGFWMQ